MFELPIDMFEKTRLWDWDESKGEAVCAGCNRMREIRSSPKNFLCGACHTLKRPYGGSIVRLMAQMVFVNEDSAIVWMNPNPDMVFASEVEVRTPLEDRSYVQDAFTFIARDINRQKPFLFICFHHKRTMDQSDLILNVDPDMLFVSANLPRPKDAHQVFKKIVDIDRANALSNINFGKMSTVDKKRLISDGYTNEDFASAHWKAAQTIAIGEPKKWF